ncbi:hypothetical protein EGW76_06060 [Enterococcus gallinarum]|nr:hypothetical protein EGW76_06060 [Enterococcus gallinarum]
MAKNKNVNKPDNANLKPLEYLFLNKNFKIKKAKIQRITPLFPFVMKKKLEIEIVIQLIIFVNEFFVLVKINKFAIKFGKIA